MALLLVALSGVFGAFFGLGYRIKNRRELPTLPVLFFFALSAGTLSFMLILFLGYPLYSEAALMFGSLHGVALGVAMILYLGVTKKSRLNITWTILQFNILVPFLASIFYYNERPSLLPMIGIALFFLSILLFGWGKKANAKSTGKVELSVGIMLFFSAFLSGVANLTAKMYSSFNTGGEILSPFSLILYSGVTMTVLLGIGLIVERVKMRTSGMPENSKRKARRGKEIVFLGVYMSALTILNFSLLITGLRTVPGAIAFPLRGLMNNVFIFILTFFLFKERANRIEMFGVAAALVSIALISYGNAG